MMKNYFSAAAKLVEKILPRNISTRLFKSYHDVKASGIVIEQQREQINMLQQKNDQWVKEIRELRSEDSKMYIILPVAKTDLQKVTIPPKTRIMRHTKHVARINKTIAWVIPPMGPVSGGHTTIFRTIRGLEKRGFICKVYIYDPRGTSNLEAIKSLLSTYPRINAEFVYNETQIDPCDAIFATNWYTAYPVYNSDASVNKFYFVQDFEPLFDVAGSYSTLADNTYKFGFHGITLGSWMKKRLEVEYSMECDNFDLRVDKDEYSLTNSNVRDKVVFYARPVTPRRGFELGILALELFHDQHPDIEIHMVGWDVSRYDIPFEYINHGIISTFELNKLYNDCAAGLVLSFTNMSLLPLEMMASGCIPVVNDAQHNRDVGYSEYIAYAIPTPQQLAEGLYEAVKKSQTKGFIESMSRFTDSFTWIDFDEKLANIVKTKLK